MKNTNTVQAKTGAVRAAEIIMNGSAYLFTEYGRKSVHGVADLINIETGAPELLNALKEAAAILRPLVHAMNVRTHFHEKNVLANVIEKAIRKTEAQS